MAIPKENEGINFIEAHCTLICTLNNRLMWMELGGIWLSQVWGKAYAGEVL